MESLLLQSQMTLNLQMTALNYLPSLFKILLMDKCQRAGGAAVWTFLSLTQLQSVTGWQDEHASLPGDASGF